MYETSFALNDLLRRKTQTSLVVACLTLSVASTLFLLLYGSRVGVGFAAANENVLTIGLSLVFAQFVRFVTILVFVVGAVLVSFTALLMMTQRTRDFGLIKATGCPNDLLFGYYMTELIIITVLGCTLGVVLGLGADYVLSSLSGFQVYQTASNLWFAPAVFVVFFILALLFGTKPIGDAVKLSPLTALSTVQYYGLTATRKAKPFTKSNLTAKFALRSLFRRRTATLRIIILLSVVFVLLTVSIAGSIIAKETTTSWIQETSGQNVILVAQENMATQYKSLQSAFTGKSVNDAFNYSDPELTIPDNIVQQLRDVFGIGVVDERLILKEHVFEIGNFTFTPNSSETTFAGDSREGDFVVIGVDPASLTSAWFSQGRFLQNADESSVVVGEWIAQNLFDQPLVQSLRMEGKQFIVVGVCVDPIENGKVIYTPLQRLENVTGIYSPNLVLLGLNSSANRAQTIAQVNSIVSNSGSNLVAFSLDETMQSNINFLGSTWSTIMLLPVFTLTSSALCLVAYVMLAVEEQRQEFGFLRAMGAKPKTVTGIVAIQSIVVLLSSLGFGLSLGTVATLLILMRNPLVTSFTIVEIGAWLLAALAGMFVLSLVPALKLARTPLLRLMT
jgi:ABC-type antimicrobial peptide transport system permease subunit